MPVNEQPFQGVRLQVASEKSYDALLTALLDDIGHAPVKMDEVVDRHPSWDAFRDEIEHKAGPSGFMLFSLLDHGAWTRKAGLSQRAMRVVLGNPLIAITMLKHDPRSGLFAPVELLLLEEPANTSSIVYVRPSSLMVVEPDQPLLDAATALDRKLAALVSKTAGG
ncbi:DUF302 domain-containing protein [Pseudomonas sp. efr-133-TYG-103a]|uniref:DUF302 domain-containing protein n=1 Tax=Pseudomonas sp. efr-133-TYG-103a TaxID=3040308 RepID=UPI002556730A|nr:DUF302 domain-containing protein [Pseudomonas sp. efr-133-TYG-103a]